MFAEKMLLIYALIVKAVAIIALMILVPAIAVESYDLVAEETPSSHEVKDFMRAFVGIAFAAVIYFSCRSLIERNSEKLRKEHNHV